MIDGLHRREPRRERAGVVLDEDAEEALHAAEDRAVQHERLRLGVLGGAVRHVEALRDVEVDLDRRSLPGAADRVPAA